MKNRRTRIITTISFLSIITFIGCAQKPPKAVPITNFQAERYLGKWYEIARFDFRFEKGLNNTTAEYSLNKNGSIKVVNRGYDYTKKKWEEAIGKAKFRGDNTVGMLKVSFFGPFYASYNIIALDSNYQYALIAGKNLEYLWILSRQPIIPEDIKQQYISIAQKVGFNTEKLIWVEHNQTK